MLGTQDNPGIYSRALNDLFKLVAQYEEENIYAVSMSYLEVRCQKSFILSRIQNM